MKTNKSFSKRIKVTRTGKITARKSGQNHFNAKEPRRKQLKKHKGQKLSFKNKDRGRFLVNA